MSGDAGRALRYFAPSPPLRPYITNLFVWTGEMTAFSAWMPAIEGQIFIRLGGLVHVRFAGTPLYRVDRPVVVGPMMGTMYMETSSDLLAVGAGMTAAGYLRLIGAEASGLADQVTDLSGLWSDRTIRLLHARLLEEPRHDHRVALLDRWLVHRLHTGPTRVDWRAAVFDHWLASGARSLTALSDELSLSHRQTGRLALAMHGMTPKGLAMRERALRAARHLAMPHSRPALSIPLGYADQSHMIRDFRRFIGITPGAFVNTAVARHVFEDADRAGTSLAIISASG